MKMERRVLLGYTRTCLVSYHLCEQIWIHLLYLRLLQFVSTVLGGDEYGGVSSASGSAGTAVSIDRLLALLFLLLICTPRK